MVKSHFSRYLSCNSVLSTVGGSVTCLLLAKIKYEELLLLEKKWLKNSDPMFLMFTVRKLVKHELQTL